MTESSSLTLRSLEGLDWEALAAAFNAGFAGYAVPMTLSAGALAAMQRRRGYWAAGSVGAFAGDELVGFALTCRDGARLYNSGTGVVPAHRGRGLARRLIEHVIEHAIEHVIRHGGAGMTSYVLEVLDDNAPAIALYRKLGFLETRGLQCWRYEPAAEPRQPLTVFGAPDLAAFAAAAAGELDLGPSWQNSLASIGRATEPYAVLGTAGGEGLLVAFPSNGDVPFFAVRAAARRRGLGRELLAGAAARLGLPLRLLNVDEGRASVAAFLTAAGATPTVRQLEMIRPLP